jgi:hypothetical protein
MSKEENKLHIMARLLARNPEQPHFHRCRSESRARRKEGRKEASILEVVVVVAGIE